MLFIVFQFRSQILNPGNLLHRINIVFFSYISQQNVASLYILNPAKPLL